MNRRKKILWLVNWYPNRYDAFDGDFIQRHAKAASLQNDIYVLFAGQWPGQTEVESCVSRYEGLTEERLYLPMQNGLVGKLQNYRQWKHHLKIRIASLVKTQRPDLIHVHVPWKMGLLALWAQQHFTIPYVVSEHWGIYNEIVADNIHKRSFLVRFLLKKIYDQANAFVSVSHSLGEAVNRTLVQKPFTIIPNVVDTSLFYFTEAPAAIFTFIHISNMTAGKNVGTILHAYKRFLENAPMATRFIFIGQNDATYMRQAQAMNLAGAVSFKGSLSYGAVAKELQHAHCHVLCSNSETFSCVTAEALCCGLPVIAPSVGALPELVNSSNGYLVNPHNGDELLAAMHDVVKKYQTFDRASIAAQAAAKYDYKEVGASFDQLYSSIVSQGV
jgi:glycosyltransferase involved in cell wall biosynthesis